MDVIRFYNRLPKEDQEILKAYIAEREKVITNTNLATLTKLDEWAKQHKNIISGRLYDCLKYFDDEYFETVDVAKLLTRRNFGDKSLKEFKIIRGY